MRLRARARAASRRWHGAFARPANNVYTEDSEPWRFYLSSQRRYLLFVPLFLAASALVGGLFGPGASTVSAAPQAVQRNASPTSDEDLKASIESFTKIYDIVDQNYSDKLSSDKAIYKGAIPGMLRTLDPHSNFFDPKEFAGLREEQH